MRSTAYRLVAQLPAEFSVVLTNAHAQDSKWGNDCWDHAIELAGKTQREHIVVLLECSREENARRIQSIGRDAKRKPRDPNMFRQEETDRRLIDRGADRLLRLDVTALSANAAAAAIVTWLKGH